MRYTEYQNDLNTKFYGSKPIVDTDIVNDLDYRVEVAVRISLLEKIRNFFSRNFPEIVEKIVEANDEIISPVLLNPGWVFTEEDHFSFKLLLLARYRSSKDYIFSGENLRKLENLVMDYYQTSSADISEGLNVKEMIEELGSNDSYTEGLNSQVNSDLFNIFSAEKKKVSKKERKLVRKTRCKPDFARYLDFFHFKKASLINTAKKIQLPRSKAVFIKETWQMGKYFLDYYDRNEKAFISKSPGTIEGKPKASDCSDGFYLQYDRKARLPHFRTNKKTEDEKFLVGIEFEVESKTRYEEFKRISKDELWHYPWLYFQWDGSLNRRTQYTGAEIVTAPLSKQWIIDNEEEFKKLFEIKNPTLKFNNFSGLHIHVSRECASDFTVVKLRRFFAENPGFISYVAERSLPTLQEWAAIPEKDGNAKAYLSSKYEAVSIRNPNTIEFRIFKPSFSYNATMRCIEFTQSILDFLKFQSFRDCTNKEEYIEYLRASERYPNLKRFLKIKCAS